MAVFRRLSPALLITLMEQTSREAADYYASLDPLAPATFGVSWAGETESLNWFDTARDLTERWHHQQQIRLAVGAPDAIFTPDLYQPVLDCFMRALPFHYRTVDAPDGTTLRIRVTGDCGGDWFLRRTGTWDLVSDVSSFRAASTAATVEIPQAIAWRIFTKGISRDEARALVRVTGDTALGEHVLGMLAIVG